MFKRRRQLSNCQITKKPL